MVLGHTRNAGSSNQEESGLYIKPSLDAYALSVFVFLSENTLSTDHKTRLPEKKKKKNAAPRSIDRQLEQLKNT